MLNGQNGGGIYHEDADDLVQGTSPEKASDPDQDSTIVHGALSNWSPEEYLSIHDEIRVLPIRIQKQRARGILTNPETNQLKMIDYLEHAGPSVKTSHHRSRMTMSLNHGREAVRKITVMVPFWLHLGRFVLVYRSLELAELVLSLSRSWGSLGQYAFGHVPLTYPCLCYVVEPRDRQPGSVPAMLEWTNKQINEYTFERESPTGFLQQRPKAPGWGFRVKAHPTVSFTPCPNHRCWNRRNSDDMGASRLRDHGKLRLQIAMGSKRERPDGNDGEASTPGLKKPFAG
jgi:hypothetical protein